MRTHRLLWSVSAWSVVALGWVCAAIGVPVPALVVVAAASAVLALMWHSLRENGVEADEGVRPVLQRTGRAVVLAVAIGSAAAGLASSAGGAGLALLAILAVTSPPVLRRLSRSGYITERATPSMSDEDLCRAWQSSYTAMQHVRDATELARLVHLRTEYLDELERRDAAGFGRWMAGLPRSDGDPSSFLRARRPPEASTGPDPR